VPGGKDDPEGAKKFQGDALLLPPTFRAYVPLSKKHKPSIFAIKYNLNLMIR